MKEGFKRRYPDLVRILQLMRYEWESWIVHLQGKLSWRQQRTIAKLRHQKGLKLNVASGGTKFPGWINVDVSPSADIRIDLRAHWPIPSDSAALIFCEHFCDHLNYPFVIGRFLEQCRRVLEPGGRARFVLHDAKDLMRAGAEGDSHYFKVLNESHPTIMTTVNHMFRFNGFHQFLYDYETFERTLLAAGFSKVVRCKFRDSEVRDLILDFDHPSREITSMYVEAVK